MWSCNVKRKATAYRVWFLLPPCETGLEATTPPCLFIFIICNFTLISFLVKFFDMHKKTPLVRVWF